MTNKIKHRNIPDRWEFARAFITLGLIFLSFLAVAKLFAHFVVNAGRSS